MQTSEHTVLARQCATGECPTAYVDSGRDGHVIIQGYTSDLEVPDGESAVSVPADLLADAVRSAVEQGLLS
jgi:hypothetical protein